MTLIRLAWLAALSLALPLAHGQAGYSLRHRGDATYYFEAGNGSGACGFGVANRLTAAINGADFAGSRACGACLLVTNPATKLSVEVRVDDVCPDCAKGDVDLAPAAFAQIADPALGRVPVRWVYTACPPAKLSIAFHPSASRWWTALQVRDHRYPVAALAWRRSGSTDAFVALPRERFNYFVANTGMGDGPFDLRLRDVYGQTVVARGVPLSVGAPVLTKVQFPFLPTVLPASRSPLIADWLASDAR